MSTNINTAIALSGAFDPVSDIREEKTKLQPEQSSKLVAKESLNSLAADLEANRLTEKLNSNQSSMISEAAEYLKLFYTEQNIPIAKMEERLAEICCEVQQTGTYWQTEAEITYGAQLVVRGRSSSPGIRVLTRLKTWVVSPEVKLPLTELKRFNLGWGENY